MTRLTIVSSLLTLMVMASLLVSALLWQEVQVLQAQLEMIQGETAVVERLDALEAQANTTESRLTGLLLAASVGLDEVATQLELVTADDLTVSVPIEEEIPIDLTVPFSTELEVPIQTEIPIDLTLDVPVDLGLLGTTTFTVPINTTVPVDLVVPVSLDTEVPINTSLPVSLEVPVSLQLDDGPLGEQIALWGASIRGFADQLTPTDIDK